VTGRRHAVLDEVKAKYPELHTIQSDVADPAQIPSLEKRIKADFPKLDVLMTTRESCSIRISSSRRPTSTPKWLK